MSCWTSGGGQHSEYPVRGKMNPGNHNMGQNYYNMDQNRNFQYPNYPGVRQEEEGRRNEWGNALDSQFTGGGRSDNSVNRFYQYPSTTSTTSREIFQQHHTDPSRWVISQSGNGQYYTSVFEQEHGMEHGAWSMVPSAPRQQQHPPHQHAILAQHPVVSMGGHHWQGQYSRMDVRTMNQKSCCLHDPCNCKFEPTSYQFQLPRPIPAPSTSKLAQETQPSTTQFQVVASVKPKVSQEVSAAPWDLRRKWLSGGTIISSTSTVDNGKRLMPNDNDSPTSLTSAQDARPLEVDGGGSYNFNYANKPPEQEKKPEIVVSFPGGTQLFKVPMISETSGETCPPKELPEPVGGKHRAQEDSKSNEKEKPQKKNIMSKPTNHGETLNNSNSKTSAKTKSKQFRAAASEADEAMDWKTWKVLQTKQKFSPKSNPNSLPPLNAKDEEVDTDEEIEILYEHVNAVAPTQELDQEKQPQKDGYSAEGLEPTGNSSLEKVKKEEDNKSKEFPLRKEMPSDMNCYLQLSEDEETENENEVDPEDKDPEGPCVGVANQNNAGEIVADSCEVKASDEAEGQGSYSSQKTEQGSEENEELIEHGNETDSEDELKSMLSEYAVAVPILSPMRSEETVAGEVTEFGNNEERLFPDTTGITHYSDHENSDNEMPTDLSVKHESELELGNVVLEAEEGIATPLINENDESLFPGSDAILNVGPYSHLRGLSAVTSGKPECSPYFTDPEFFTVTSPVDLSRTGGLEGDDEPLPTNWKKKMTGQNQLQPLNLKMCVYPDSTPSVPVHSNKVSNAPQTPNEQPTTSTVELPNQNTQNQELSRGLSNVNLKLTACVKSMQRRPVVKKIIVSPPRRAEAPLRIRKVDRLERKSNHNSRLQTPSSPERQRVSYSKILGDFYEERKKIAVAKRRRHPLELAVKKVVSTDLRSLDPVKRRIHENMTKVFTLGKEADKPPTARVSIGYKGKIHETSVRILGPFERRLRENKPCDGEDNQRSRGNHYFSS